MSLFDDPEAQEAPDADRTAPLAERMIPFS